MPSIDLNCDCGESFGPWPMGDDAAILAHVTSANVACGGHAGDPSTMRRTVRLCKALGVAVGAHPGYPDLQGFGRRSMAIPPHEIEDLMLAQIGALAAIVQAEGVRLRHVKPHGALYNDAAHNPALAAAIARAVVSFNPDLVLVGLAGSVLLDAGQEVGLRVVGEGFADRTYEADGRLRQRQLAGALIDDPEQSLRQVLQIALHGQVQSHTGSTFMIQAGTICLHGDAPAAAQRAAIIRHGLEAAGVVVQPF
ncbi:LamB/YcsF family protein [Oscillochloris trichoides DG-6]|uniref:5-oxoprolinase subunit A n=1 Tax=Oscillochloris trichoides DG-6 TaxID=765420 RepID=E1IBR4_9CHLR|nr:5-oxoprolinase subunit PxpA [Oscillochloris trichoides]EFO81366.1 LamB/YcsF family protein [Oscillochloris trichoides DG-6]